MILSTWWCTSRPRPGTCSDGDGASCGKPVSEAWQGNILRPWYKRSFVWSGMISKIECEYIFKNWEMALVCDDGESNKAHKVVLSACKCLGEPLYDTILSGQKNWHLLNTDLDHGDGSDDVKYYDDDFDRPHPGTGLDDDDGNDVLEHDDDDDNNDRPHLGTALAHLRQTLGCLRPGHLPPKYGSEQSWWRWCQKWWGSWDMRVG